MNCKYIYKGHIFESEVELDDYLLQKRKFEDKFGDIVFSKSALQLHTVDKIDEMNKATIALKEAFQYKKVYLDGEEVGERSRPYIGVTRFLSTITDSKGNYLFPIFKEENYWKEKINTWTDSSLNRDVHVIYNPDKKIGVFTKEEIDLIFDGDIDKARYLTKEEAEKWKEIITNKWEQQAKMGTAFHKVMEIFFSKDSNGNYNFTKTDEDLIEILNKKETGLDFNYINLDIIKQAIDLARKLKTSIASSLGENEDTLDFFPELNVKGPLSIELSEGINTLIGNIDIAVIDSKGVTHIFDYKTSPKQFVDYSSAKKLAFTYQQATYARMLQRAGINTEGAKIGIIPVQFKDFKLTNKDEALINPKEAKFNYGGIQYDENDLFRDLAPQIKTQASIQKHMEDYMPKTKIISAPTDDIIKSTKKRMEENFPGFSQYQSNSDEQLRDKLKKEGAFKKQDNGKYEYSFKGGYQKFIADTEEEMFKKVKEAYADMERNTEDKASVLYTALKWGQDNNTTDITEQLGNLVTKKPKVSSDINWFLQYAQKYCNPNWTVEEEPAALAFGIVILRNKLTNQIDFIQVTSQNLTYLHNYKDTNGKYVKDRSNLTYGFESNIVEAHNSQSYMLQAYTGNIKLMECMFIINKLAAKFQDGAAKVGHIQITNPYTGDAMSAKNEELLYCYKKLAKYTSVAENEEDYILNGKVQFSDQVDLFSDDLETVLQSEDKFYGKGDVKSLKTGLEQARSNEEKIEALTKIANLLLQKNKTLINVNSSNISKEARLYNKCLMAIAELSGLHLRQQVSDHDKYLENRNIKVFTEGWSGSYVDNPGNLKSDTLNVLTKLVAQGYQSIRQSMADQLPSIRKEVTELKESKNWHSNIQNETKLFTHMFNTKYENDLVLKNPDDPIESAGLTEADKKFMRFFLRKINERRYSDMTKAELEDMRLAGDKRYYEIPLSKASASSEVAARGMMGFLKRKLGLLASPTKLVEEARAYMEGIFDPKDAQNIAEGTNLFEMNNMFEKTASQRQDALDFRGKDYFETNLETLLLKHEFSYISKQEMDKILPRIKATLVHLRVQEENNNVNLKDDVQYANDYLKAVVHNMPIDKTMNEMQTKEVLKTVKKAASFMTLGFSVRQLYQFIQHAWQDISLVIRKPDGTYAFSPKNMMSAIKIVYADLLHYSDTPTKVQLINELYGVNDMDMNTYIERIQSTQGLLANIQNFAYKFSSRPDYYGRMTIIVAKMLADGTWDAYEVKDGKLVYNFKKDKRFSDIANGKKNPKQLALYYAIGKQLINEGFVMPDGQPFRFNTEVIVPLPVPYSSQEIESMKNITDTAYGYYTHERKSLMHYNFLGSLMMQMRTYWSGKKNQYMQSGGVKVQGSWQQATDEQGNKMYYQIQDGVIRTDLPPVKESELKNDSEKLAPFLVWKGQWQEGIFVTLSSIAHDVTHGNQKFGIAETLQVIFDDNAKFKTDIDPDLLRMYRANLRQILYDIIVYLVVGTLFGGVMAAQGQKLTKKANETGSISDGMVASAVNLSAKMLGNSANDFAFWDSIGTPLGQITPFAFESIKNQAANWSNVAFGDKNFWGGVVNTFSATKDFKPALSNVHAFYDKD